MDAGKRSLSDIFNGGRVLEIPFFQRAYVWGEDQWERLIDDMESITRSQKPYFLGSVILKQQSVDSSQQVGDKRTLIDGQQRLTTLMIFFKVLCLLEKEGSNAPFQRLFVLEDDILALWHNHNNIESFETVMKLETLDELEPGNDVILRAYNYFLKNLNPEKLNRYTILQCLMFIGIDLSDREDEQQIFDTINSLGVRLTTAELLKNHFFGRGDITVYEEYWKIIFENDEDTKSYWDAELTTGSFKRSAIDILFFSYLQIKMQEPSLNVSAIDKAEYSKVETLFESYKSFMADYKLEKEVLLGEIREYAIIFRSNIDPDIAEKELTEDFGIDRVNAIIFGLKTSTLITYVLYVLKNVQDLVTRNDLFGAVETYVLRRIICRGSSKNYNQLFSDSLVANKICTKNEFFDFVNKNEESVNHLPNDDDIKYGFSNSVLTNKQAAGVLYFLESKIRDRAMHSTQLLGVNKYSLEHLMPKKWETNWGSLDTPDLVVTRKRKLLTLGNLTIITQSLNSSIRDSDWEKKKEGSERSHGLIYYSTGIETLAPYLQLYKWDEDEIDVRANKLCKSALEFWDINK